MRQVLSGEEPILAVYHDEDDHGWQFIGTTNANESDGRVIALHEAIELDPTITELLIFLRADLRLALRSANLGIAIRIQDPCQMIPSAWIRGSLPRVSEEPCFRPSEDFSDHGNHQAEQSGGGNSAALRASP